jgi:NAD(P) transhydrogenase subunit alpha
MKIGVPKETRAGETRVAATPDSVKKLKKKGCQVLVERGAGAGAFYGDDAYTAAGAEIVDRASAFKMDVVLMVNKPSADEIGLLGKSTLLIAHLEPYNKDGTLEKLAQAGVDAIAMELIPRTSRAQSMDSLSSQAGIAGYRAVLEAATQYPRFFPMMMTSAGSAKACKLAVLGAGVAGLQAIATGRKLGAQVEGYDVRKEVKEQITSLGAKFIEVEVGEEGSGQGGYAKELSEDAKAKQQAALGEKLKKFDVIVTTANIPGRKSPTLITEDAVKGMRAGSVIIDMAAANGGNCPLTEAGKTVVKHGVKIVGITNYPTLMPTDASGFYAQNLVHLLDILIENKDGKTSLNLNMQDDIIAAALTVHKGDLCRRP